jgi:hypothetical protein
MILNEVVRTGHFRTLRKIMKTHRLVTTFTSSALLAGTFACLPAKAATPVDDKQFLSMAAQSDMNEIKLSQLAETKA